MKGPLGSPGKQPGDVIFRTPLFKRERFSPTRAYPGRIREMDRNRDAVSLLHRRPCRAFWRRALREVLSGAEMGTLGTVGVMPPGVLRTARMERLIPSRGLNFGGKRGITT